MRTEEECLELFDDNLYSNEPSQISFIIAVVGTAFFSVYATACYVYFLRQRKKYTKANKRNVTMLSMYYIGTLISLYAVGPRILLGPQNLSCTAYGVVAIALLVFSFQPQFSRLASLFFRINFSRSLINYNFHLIKVGGWNAKPGKQTFAKAGEIEEEDKYLNMSSKIIGFKRTKDRNKRLKAIGKRFGPCLYKITCYSPPKDIPDILKFEFFLSTERFSNVLFAFMGLLETAAALILYYFLFDLGQDCFGCYSLSLGVILYPPIVLLIILAIVFFTLLRNVPDSLGIKTELSIQVTFFAFFFILVVVLVNVFEDTERNQDFIFSQLFLIPLTFNVTYGFPYQIYLAKKSQKRTGGVHADIRYSLEEILEHEEGSQAFALYLASSLCLENLYFYKAIKNWKQKFDSLPKVVQHQTALELFNNFVRNESPYCINISYTIRQEIERVLNEEDINVEIFDDAYESVKYLMESDSFGGFLKSIYYKAFIAELVEDEPYE